MVWIKDKPRLDGEWYWFKLEGSPDSEARPIKVNFKNSDYQMTEGRWSHCPIPYPETREE